MPQLPFVRTIHIGPYSPNEGPHPTDEIPLEGKYVAVYPKSGVYALDLENEDGSTSVREIAGLGRASLFVLGHTTSRHVLDGEALEWGKAYALIQRLKIAPGLFPASIPSFALSENDGWHAYIFGLPVKQDAAVIKWAKESFGREIHDHLNRFIVLSPIASRLVGFDTWLIPPEHGSVIVGFTVSRAPSKVLSFTLVSDRGVRIERHFTTTFGAELFIDLGPLSKGLFELRVSESDLSTLRLDVRDRQDYAPPARIGLAFDTGDRIVSATLWHLGLVDLLAKVRDGMFRLDEIRLPEIGELSLTELANGQRVVEVFQFGPYSVPSVVASQRILARLRDLLAGRERRFELDAGGFGRVCFPPLVPDPASAEVAATATSRSRIPKEKHAWLDLALRGRSVVPRPQFLRYSDPRCRFTAHLHQISR